MYAGAAEKLQCAFTKGHFHAPDMADFYNSLSETRAFVVSVFQKQLGTSTLISVQQSPVCLAVCFHRLVPG